uniref:DUF6598 domain-containing protein n=1 Tax=Oryza glumipatula TaxID=40148 RepID=A0A0E0BPN1_9ORYZ
MEVDMEAEGASGELGHKRADLEKPTEEERASNGGGDAAKTPSEDHHDSARRRAMAMENDDDDDDEYYDEPLPNPLDAYRQSWARSYGTNGATFEDETDLPPMPNTDIPVLPPSAQPMETMQVFTVKVTQITGGLRWPLGVYGVVAVRDSMYHKRNVLFRRCRNECQTLTSLQACANPTPLSYKSCSVSKFTT